MSDQTVPGEDEQRRKPAGQREEAREEPAVPAQDAPPLPADDPELGADGTGAGELP